VIHVGRSESANSSSCYAFLLHFELDKLPTPPSEVRERIGISVCGAWCLVPGGPNGAVSRNGSLQVRHAAIALNARPLTLW
jgi:hypothetical protein